MRVSLVWIGALAIFSLVQTSGEGFLIVFMSFGMFWTLPALFVLSLLAAGEKFFVRRGGNFPALLLGPFGGLLTAFMLSLIVPKGRGSIPALDAINMLCIGTGVLWMLTYLLLKSKVQENMQATKSPE